jgi:hypothetical protein
MMIRVAMVKILQKTIDREHLRKCKRKSTECPKVPALVMEKNGPTSKKSLYRLFKYPKSIRSVSNSSKLRLHLII